MAIPVPIPAGPLVINDTINARAEALLAAFTQAVKAGTSGAVLTTPASTTADPNTGSTSPVLIDTPEKQLFFRQQMLGIASVLLSAKASGEVVGTTSDPTSASASFVVIPQMTLTLTTLGGTVLVAFSSSFNINAADSLDFSIFVDGSEQANSRRHAQCATAIAGLPSSTQAVVVGLAAGSHTFDVRWKADAGSARALGVLRSLSVAEY